MTTFYCDIDEAAIATSTILSGFDTQIGDTAVASDVFLFELSTLLTSSAVATSEVSYEVGFSIVEHATAASYLIDDLDAVNDLVSYATVTSELFDDPYDLAVSSGVTTSTLVDSSDTLAVSTGIAVSALIAYTTREQLVVEAAVATTELFGFSDSMIVENAAATSAMFDQRSSSSQIIESAAAVSALFSTNVTTDDIVEQAVAASMALFGSDSYDDYITETAVAYSVLFATPRNGAWVTNTETMAMSRYTGLPVDSIAMIGGLTLGLRQDGLLVMGGDTDEGTPYYPSIRTGASVLGAQALKQIGDVLISYVCAGTMAVRVATYGGKNEGTYTYELPTRRAAAPRANRLTVGKGLRGRYFSFEFTTLDGSSFDVDSVTADVAVNTRRV